MIEPVAAMESAAADVERDAPNTHSADDANRAQAARRASQSPAAQTRLLRVLASVGGLIVWLSLILLTRGTLSQAGATPLLSPFTQWGALQNPSLSASNPSGFMAGVTKAGVPAPCDRSGVSSMGSDLIVPESEVVCGDVLVIGANAVTYGEVRGSVQVIGGSATISGDVTGDVSVIGGDIMVQPGGHVYGNVRSVGGSVVVSPSAIANNTSGDMQMPQDLTRPPGLNFTIDIGSFWLSLLFWVSAALGLTALAPEAIGQVHFMISHHLGLSAIVGALLAVAGTLISIVLVFTCLGIPLALAIAAAGWLAWVIGTVSLGAWLGGAIFGRPFRPRAPSLLASAVLGVFILSVLKALPIVGPVIGMLAGVVALGAATLTLLSARRAVYTHAR
jgi:hypothetical protein